MDLSMQTRRRLGARTLRSRDLAAAPQSALTLEFVLFLLSLVMALIGSTRWVHPAWSIVALANFVWLGTLLFRFEPRGTMLLLPQLINSGSGMIALVMIEYGAEMFELGIVGRPGPWSNALNLYSLAVGIGFIMTVRPLIAMLDRRGDNALSPILDKYANLLATLVLLVVGLIAIALVLRGLVSGFPLLAGIDRFQFRRFSADKVTLYALNLKFVIGYALGVIAFVLPVRRTLRLCAKLAFAVLLVLYFLFGDKFFTQLGALTAFMAPYVYIHHAKVRQQLGRYLIITTLALSAVTYVTVFIYSNGFAETTAATTKRLSGRIVGQGELWFLQSSIGAPMLRWNAPLIDRYIPTVGIKSVDLYAAQNSLGPHYFSNGYAPDYLRASLQRNAGSATYTAVTEAMGLVLFGWLGLGLMMLVLGMILGLSCAYIAYAIANRSILSTLFAAFLYVQVRTSIVQAAPWVVASIYSARWQVLILLIELGLLLLARASTRSDWRSRRLAPRPRPRRQRIAEPTV